MCQLPRTQPKAAALTTRMIAGFTDYPDTFPSADIHGLQNSLDNFYEARHAFTAALAAFKQAGKKQKDAFEELRDAIANQIKAAQVDTSGYPVKLGLIGFGARRKKTSINLPAQPQLLDIKSPAAGVVKLQWEKRRLPGCGRVQSFIIESRIMTDRGAANWLLAGMSFDCQAILRGPAAGSKIGIPNNRRKSFR